MPIRSRCQLCNEVIEYDADALTEPVFVNCPKCGEETEVRPVTWAGQTEPRRIELRVAEPPKPKSAWRQDGPLVLVIGGAVAVVAIIVLVVYLPRLFAGTVGIVGLLAVMVCGLAVYFLPTIVARGKKQFAPVFLVNLLLGWTCLGWVVALVWAAMNQDDKLKFNRRG